MHSGNDAFPTAAEKQTKRSIVLRWWLRRWIISRFIFSLDLVCYPDIVLFLYPSLSIVVAHCGFELYDSLIHQNHLTSVHETEQNSIRAFLANDVDSDVELASFRWSTDDATLTPIPKHEEKNQTERRVNECAHGMLNVSSFPGSFDSQTNNQFPVILSKTIK